MNGITGARLYNTILMHQLINLIVAPVTSIMNLLPYTVLYLNVVVSVILNPIAMLRLGTF